MAKIMKKSRKKAVKRPAVKKTTPKKAATANVKKGKTAPKRTPISKAVKIASVPPKKISVIVKGYSKTDLEKFRKLILEKRQEIIEDLEMLKTNMMDVTTGEYTQENNSYSLHMEQGTDTMEREKTFLFASREGKYLQYLEDALQRIDRGNYGVCGDCGKLIERGRLEAVPIATLCVDCKIKKGAKSPVA